MNNNLTKLIISLFVFFVLLLVFLPVQPFSEKETVFEIEKGQGSRDIAIALEREGLILWGPVFRVYVLTIGISGDLQAGNYLLSPSMSMAQIADKLSSGKVIEEKITIIEGWDMEDIGNYFEEKGIAKIKDLYEFGELEGYLFPDTYTIKKGESLEEIITKMHNNFNKKTEGLDLTKDDIIMASILEREIQTKEDKELVSGILWKRIRVGMPLQVDAELWTYDNLGLPSLPICNPGLESIKAALNPIESVYWYYISTPEGETVFSKTLAEHNQAIYKYLK